jgi:hypothetical protein
MIRTRLFAVATVAAAAALASLAQAQPYGPPPPPGASAPGAWDIGQRIHWIRDRIIRGRNDGSLDPREYNRVDVELRSIEKEDQVDRYHNGGHLDGPTRYNLEERLNHLNDQIHWIRVRNEARPW